MLTINDLSASRKLDTVTMSNVRGGMRWERGSSTDNVIDLTRCQDTAYVLGTHFCKGSDGMWRGG